jgi:tRNA 2-thiouridine synthesizing protein E
MAIVEHMGKSFEIDEDGFIDAFESWNPEWVDYVKASEGIQELTEEHWKVIHVLQDYYQKHGIAPMVRILTKVTYCPHGANPDQGDRLQAQVHLRTLSLWTG